MILFLLWSSDGSPDWRLFASESGFRPLSSRYVEDPALSSAINSTRDSLLAARRQEAELEANLNRVRSEARRHEEEVSRLESELEQKRQKSLERQEEIESLRSKLTKLTTETAIELVSYEETLKELQAHQAVLKELIPVLREGQIPTTLLEAALSRLDEEIKSVQTQEVRAKLFLPEEDLQKESAEIQKDIRQLHVAFKERRKEIREMIAKN